MLKRSLPHTGFPHVPNNWPLKGQMLFHSFWVINLSKLHKTHDYQFSLNTWTYDFFHVRDQSSRLNSNPPARNRCPATGTHMGGEGSARCQDVPRRKPWGLWGPFFHVVTCIQADHDILQLQNGSLGSESLSHYHGFVKTAPNKGVNERTGLKFQFSLHGFVHLKNTRYPLLPEQQ